ncbi:MAG: CCA tRNA nucleotidyltransferase [Actinomycetota bacterium]|nr:CCA tRNA nucleotidyltransferase [Actinomycetota bacterium]
MRAVSRPASFAVVIPERFRPVVEETAPLARRFAAAGRRLYLVGGTVRDGFVGRPGGGATFDETSDVDCTTEAGPEEIESIVRGWADAVWLQGKAFGTVGCSYRGRRFEITTHRAEAYAPDSRKPSVEFGEDVETDLSRRDFTVNAMALSLPDVELVDPHGGLADLAAKVLRTPLDPEESFGDDPLRMLRAARFVAGYDLEPVPELVAAIERLAPRLEIVSAERVRDELDKLLVLPDPSPGLWLVVRTGLAAQFLPELPALELEQDPVHRHKDVLAHTVAVVAKTRPERTLRLAALLHDVGKPRTRAFGPGGVSFHHHDVVGARMARARMEQLRYPGAEIAEVGRLVELHLRFHTYQLGWTDSAIRRYARDAGPLLGRLNELTRADCTTRNRQRALALGRRMDELEERLASLREREALDAIRPELDGSEVMEQLGIGPGPDVGRALAYLLEIRLDEGLLGEAEVRRRLADWWRLERPG